MFDLARLAAAHLVAQIDFHEVIGSTSDRALAVAASEEVRLPLLVLAERQTAGRGRGGNQWSARTGALTFSLLVHAPPERLPAARWPQVALAAGLAICEALAELAPSAEPRLKWPNDVYLGGRKIAGILSESATGSRDRLIIGIGINMNNSMRGGELESIATSLIDHDGISRDLTSALLVVLDHFERRWQTLLEDGFEAIVSEFRSRCWLTGRRIAVQPTIGEPLRGQCRGIDDLGRLVLVTASGPQALASGSVIDWD